jgi:hypothetical protein
MPSTATPYYAIEADYGYGDGYEEVCAETDRREAQDRLREYRENDQYARRLRIVRRRDTDETRER